MPKKHAKTTRTTGSGIGEAQAGDTSVPEYQISRERARMLAERQAKLDSVLDRHDDMVREVFHLEQFVTLLEYDPKVSKQDDSKVFQEYKAKYDLLERATAAAGPSRSTRRAHTQRVFDLTSLSPVKNAPSASTKSDVLCTLPLPPPSELQMLATALSSKAKGKQKAIDAPMDDAPVSISAQNGTAKTRPRPRIPGPDHSEPKPLSISASQPLKRTSSSVASPPLSPVLKKKRKSMVGLDDSASGVSHPRRSGRLEGSSKPPDLRLVAHPFTDLSSHVSNPPPSISRTSSIKRVRLIVRRPPPTYTNPRQKPPPPRFASNLTDFLSSYTTLGEQEQTPETLEALTQSEAALREKIDRLHKQGRFVPFLYGEPFKGSSSGKLAPVPAMTITANPDVRDLRRSKDAWEHIVEMIVHRGRHGGGGGAGLYFRGRQVAAQVASRIHAYWDQSAVREDKARMQEEKRLKALAKAMVKMVVAEWKKAVYYIREEGRQQAEAEEMRRGHEHLDAILDQSGQILETQQVDLSRGELSRSRSRSSSVSTSEWEEGSTGTSQGEGAEENEGEEGSGAESAEEFGVLGMLDDADEGDVGRDESDESSEDDDDSGETTHALLGLTHCQEDAVPAPTPTDRADADVVMEPEVSTHSPSGFSIGQGTSTLAKTPTMFEDTAASPSVPSDMDSIARTPTLGDAQSPALESFYDYRMQDEPSPASSVIDHDPVKDSAVSAVTFNERTVNGTMELEDVDATLDRKHDVVDAGGDETKDDDVSQALPELDSDPAVPMQVQSAEPEPDADADALMEVVENDVLANIPEYLKPFAVAPVDWSSEDKIKPPLLLRGVLRPYQQSGLEWLTSLHSNNLNGILADEMGLGKTIQTIALLAHLACDRGIWGPHLIIVPTSVLLNWEMEFKKFLPGFKTLSYHGSTKRRKELRQGWYNKHHFNVCITSYTLASRDAHIFKRKMWYYMILDEAHMIKNFRSQRWNILLMFRSFRRLLLTGTPLQNNLTELWALLQFLMSGTNFANLKEFGEWFSNPLEKAIEMGTMLDDENLQRVSKLHTVLRPYLLRRLKRDVEKELPSKYEHLVPCPLSKRQRFLYDEFMSRAHTREALESGVYQKIANVLMQLRKVCNHPDLFEVRPVVTSLAMTRSAIADFEIKELLVRRELLRVEEGERVNLDLFGLRFVDQQDVPLISALETRRLDATHRLPLISEMPGEPPPKDLRTIAGYRDWRSHQQRMQKVARWAQIGYVNHLRCARTPIYGQELLRTVQRCRHPILPQSAIDLKNAYLDTVTTTNAMVKSYEERAEQVSGIVDRFTFATPAVIALDLPRLALTGYEEAIMCYPLSFDNVLHRTSIKLQIMFPDPSLLQYDCGKLQELSRLLRQKKAGGHRILIFTQMTRVLDILEIFLNFHGYLYLRLDGATKIEDRQYITERFNADARIFCFISSSRSGGVGINLTGADTVIFYDSDFNPQMDRQCEDRAHRIGQIRDVHIYRFISSHTVEEAMLMKANQKRSLDDIVIQKGEFDWRSLFEDDGALTRALGECEDSEDAQAAMLAAREEDVLEGADQADFGAEEMITETRGEPEGGVLVEEGEHHEPGGEDGDEGGSVSDYMIRFVRTEWDFFRDWRP